ncbi:hypothetical protein OIN60_15345 [Paenibacillus sp. P96]|uniref:Uncharacterized protein n=1 Tax=Paenibacillus zeirhizosphaerae TaxID=2987519 RepID=A0ABT9FTR6_9BACL|nr:hypothetical protein [Paenibacillus sp. P96]MDP4098133.1 hypothetical protein [Paenibacillus sp. P96]
MKSIYNAQGLVFPDCTHSHITYAFHMPEPVQAVCVRFAYDPKLLTDEQQAKEMIQDSMWKYGYAGEETGGDEWRRYAPLKNLLTLSVDDSVRHRGTAHRHDPQQEHLLGRTEASPGFLAGENPAGIWRLTVSLHAVVTERVSYRLEVAVETMQEGGTQDEMDSSRAAHSHLS